MAEQRAHAACDANDDERRTAQRSTPRTWEARYTAGERWSTQQDAKAHVRSIAKTTCNVVARHTCIKPCIKPRYHARVQNARGARSVDPRAGHAPALYMIGDSYRANANRDRLQGRRVWAGTPGTRRAPLRSPPNLVRAPSGVTCTRRAAFRRRSTSCTATSLGVQPCLPSPPLRRARSRRGPR